jgi:hypothetical protein
MNSRGASVNDDRSDLGPDLRKVLERLAHHAALEARLHREDVGCLDAAVAAVRRVSLNLVCQQGLEVREDERGDVWALHDGVAVAFLGNGREIGCRALAARDADQLASVGKRSSLRSTFRSAASQRSIPTRSAR